MSQCIRLPQPLDLPVGRSRVVQVEDHSIALFNVEGAIYAIDDNCPHNGASLASGRLEGLSVQCPAHGLKFDLKTGCMRYSPDLKVRTYAARLEDGWLEIELPDDCVQA